MKSVVWKKSEIKWGSFEDVIIEEKVNAPIVLIWLKLQSEGMEKLQYAFDRVDGDCVNFYVSEYLKNLFFLVNIT